MRRRSQLRFPILFGMVLLLIAGGESAAQRGQSTEPNKEGNPYQRWLWEFEQRAFPLGYIPDGARLRALRQIKRWKESRIQAVVQGDRWINVGPAPIKGGQVENNAGSRPVSGRIADVAIDPSDPNHWLIGAAQGGIWVTRDGGQTWAARTDDQPSLAMGAIAFAPGDSSIVYAGTGEATYGGHSYFGAGLLKSTDGGKSWSVLNQADFRNASISDILVHPQKPKILVVAKNSGRAGLSGEFVATRGGVLKSEDGGTTWDEKRAGEATDLEVDPRDFNRQYAGFGFFTGISNNGVFRSRDAGETWDRVSGPWEDAAKNPGGVGRVELAIAPSNPNVLYVSIQDAGDGQPPAPNNTDFQLLGLWRTNQAWKDPLLSGDFVQITNAKTATNDGRSPPTAGYCGNQCFYDHEIIVDLSNPDTLYAGGVPLWRCEDCRNGTVAKWTNISDLPHISDANQSIHVDQHTMAWAASKSKKGSKTVSSLPVVFEANEGQADEAVQFLANGPGYTVLLEPTRQTFILEGFRLSGENAERPNGDSSRADPRNSNRRPNRRVFRRRVRMSFEGGNSKPRMIGIERLPGRVHYITGNDPSQWHRNIPIYTGVRYEEIYPGIDLLFHGGRPPLAYDLVVAPGADPGVIHLRYAGSEKLELDSSGDLLVKTPAGTLRQGKPVVFQAASPSQWDQIWKRLVSALRLRWLGGARASSLLKPVSGEYLLDSNRRVRFRLGGYDVTQQLVIDPQISREYSSYLWGGGPEDVAVDSSRMVYLTGPDFSTQHYIAKMDPTQAGAKGLIYKTNYTLSTGGADTAFWGIAVDSAGSAYVTGQTWATDFPILNPLPGQAAHNANAGSDAFVLKLDPTGSAPVYSTYLGGSDQDRGMAIAVDSSNSAYVMGYTTSEDFPQKKPLQSFNLGKTECLGSCQDAFVVKLQPDGSDFVYSTFLGGSDLEDGTSFSENFDGMGGGLAVDSAGNAYVTGGSMSSDFPQVTADGQKQSCWRRAFVTQLDPTGSSLVYSVCPPGTFQGHPEISNDIALDSTGNAFVVGTEDPGGFLLRLDTTGRQDYYTSLNGNSVSLAVTPTGTAFFAERIECSSDYGAFLNKLQFFESGVVPDTLMDLAPDCGLPATGVDLALDASGAIYVTGSTRDSSLFTTPNAFQDTKQGFYSGFLMKLVDLIPTRLIVGNDGGVWSTTDGGRTWADHNTNLAITQFYAGSVSAQNPDFALGGSQDNGTEEWTGTADWRWIGGGDGGPSAISLANAEGWAFSSQQLNIKRTVDALRTTPDRVDVNIFSAAQSIDGTNRPFVGRFEKCPSNDDVFIAGTDNLWRTNNFFSGFNSLNDTGWSRNSPEWNSKISALAFAPSDDSCSTYALGTEDGQLHITSDGGNSWKDLDPAGGVPIRWITDLAFDEFSAQTLYVTVSGFQQAADPPNLQAHLFKTTGALAATPSWAPAGPPVDIPHNTIVVDPSEPNQLFVGTDIGVWRSTDAGANWTHLGPATGMPNVAVLDLQIGRFTSQLVAFTHGRGVFRFAPDVSADLTLTKTDSADPVFAGDPITYTVTVKNNGPDTAPNVTVRDWLPPGMTPVAVSTTPGACTGTSPIICTIGDMANGAMATMTVDVTAPSDPGSFCNLARVSSPAVDLNPGDNEFNPCTTVRKEADLSITKAGAPDPVTVAQNLTYSVTVTNNGPNDASAVSVRDTLPPEVAFVSASSSQGSCTGTGAVNCFFGNVVRGATATATIVVKAPSVKTTLSNTATVSGNEEDRKTGNNTAATLTSVIDPAGIADVAVTKTGAPDPVQVNQNITYSIVVRNNNGPDVANGVVVTDTLPAGVILLSASSSRGPCTGANPVTCNIGTLVPGESVAVTVVVQATAVGTVTNRVTATITGPEIDSDNSNNTAVAQTTVQGPTGTTTTTSTTIPTGSPCDLDGDGQINVLDVQSSVNRLLNGGGEMDLNHDGRSDVLDLQILINVVLGTTSCPDGSTTTTSSADTTTSTSFTTTTTTTTTTTAIPTTTTTTTTSTTSTSTTSTSPPTTTTTTSTTTTTTSISSTTTTTTPQPTACDLFGDDFNDGDASDWAFADAGTWQVVDGLLQVGSISANAMAIAQHDVPVPTFFRLLVDVEAAAFDGTVYGFEPFSQTETFTLQLDTGPATIDGMGAAVYRDPADGILKAAFLVFDVNANTFLVLNATDYGAVTSLGIEWEGDGITLIVNGVERQTIPATALGQTTLPVPSLDLLWLLSTGSQTLMQFDNVCQSSLAVTTASGTRLERSLSGRIREDLAAKAGSGRLIQAHLPTRSHGN